MQTLVDLVREAAAQHAAQPALSLHGGRRERWTRNCADLWQWSRRAASHLCLAGVEQGDRAVRWGTNRPEWVAAMFGTQIVGAVVVSLDERSREDLLGRIGTQTSPKYMFIGKGQAGRLGEGHAPHLRLEELRERLATVAPIATDDPSVGPSDIAELVFTLGTTGHSRGVILTMRIS